jgi:predicted nucleotidyltransferase
VTRDDFDPERSDVDVLVEFRNRETPGLRFFATMPDELSTILGGRKIDLFTFDGLSPSIARHVQDDLIDEYVEGS